MDRCLIHVDNLPFKCTQSDIKHYFDEYGEIDDVRLLRNRDGKFKGIALVRFKDPRDAKDAIKYGNGKRFMGRPLSVTEDRGNPRRQSPPPPDHHDMEPRRSSDIRGPFPAGGGYRNIQVSRSGPVAMQPPMAQFPPQMPPQQMVFLQQPQQQRMVPGMQPQMMIPVQQMQYPQIQMMSRKIEEKKQNPEIAYYKKVIERIQEELRNPNLKDQVLVEIDDHGVPTLSEDEN